MARNVLILTGLGSSRNHRRDLKQRNRSQLSDKPSPPPQIKQKNKQAAKRNDREKVVTRSKDT